MKSKLARIHCLDRVAAAITEQVLHDFNLKKQETTNLKREVSNAKMLRKWEYLRMLIYYGGQCHDRTQVWLIFNRVRAFFNYVNQHFLGYGHLINHIFEKT